MQDGKPFNTDSLINPNQPFIGDSPYTFWRIDENANGGRPYVGLMIGVPVLAGDVAPDSYYNENKVPRMYYGDIPIYDAYYGNKKIES